MRRLMVQARPGSTPFLDGGEHEPLVLHQLSSLRGGQAAWVGFLTGALGGMVGSAFMIVLCVWLGLDQIVVGIAITLAGEGITSVLQGAQFGTTYPRLGAASTFGWNAWCRGPAAVSASWTWAAERATRWRGWR